MTIGRILIIDDEDIVLRSCQRILNGEGYDLDVASDGFEALAMIDLAHLNIVHARTGKALELLDQATALALGGEIGILETARGGLAVNVLEVPVSIIEC